MDANHDNGRVRFPSRDGIGSTFVRNSGIAAPALDAEPSANQESTVDLASATISSEEFVTIDRGDGFVWRVRVNTDASTAEDSKEESQQTRQM